MTEISDRFGVFVHDHARDLSHDIKRLREEMDDAKRKLESLESTAAELAGRADQTDSRLEKIETNAQHFKMR